LQKLDKIRDEKLWQRGRDKEYHTEVTDVLREYIQGNTGIDAPDMTSYELLGALDNLRHENKTAFQTLNKILQLADLVKFAKWRPLPDENEQSLKDAYFFVNETKTEETQISAEIKDEKTIEKNDL
jgi:hypothetical protein